MNVSGTYTFKASREDVWAALNDLDVLARVVPGCQSLAQVGDNDFEGIVKIGIQSIRGTYQGRIRLEDIQPPSHYRLIATGKGANAVIDGAGTIDLIEDGENTVIKYGGEAQIGGQLASVGQRLIEGAARQLINQSLKALEAQIAARRAAAAAPVAEAAPAADAAPVAEAAPAAETAPRRTVVVPPDEQLKPEAMALGVIKDLIAQSPWIALAIALVLGFLLGRSGRR